MGMNLRRKTMKKPSKMYLGRTTLVVSVEWAQQLPHQSILVGGFSLCQEMKQELALVAHTMVSWNLCCPIWPRNTQKMIWFHVYHHILESSWYVKTEIFLCSHLQMPISYTYKKSENKMIFFPLNGRLLTGKWFNCHLTIRRQLLENHPEAS
jgi:hypothetical protein